MSDLKLGSNFSHIWIEFRMGGNIAGKVLKDTLKIMGNF